jgi:hypothetical protein
VGFDLILYCHRLDWCMDFLEILIEKKKLCDLCPLLRVSPLRMTCELRMTGVIIAYDVDIM